MAQPTEILGIHQSDIVIRTAINEALKRIYADPSLLDYVFQSLLQDPLTSQEYGEKQIELAKKWFLNQQIPVFMSVFVNGMALPCITIGLMESTEAEQTHGDVNYVVQEDTEGNWPALTKPFTPLAYSVTTGMMLLPAGVMGDVVVAPGMNVLARSGRLYQIIDNLDDDLITIKPGITEDFIGAIIKAAKSKYVTTIESVNFKETYQIGVHVQDDPVKLIFLHSILKFALLKYKQDLLEARNFERTVLASTDLRRNMEFDAEVVFDRFINITGYCREWWPKEKRRKVSVVEATGLIIEPPRFVNEDDPALDDQGLPPSADDPWSVKV